MRSLCEDRKERLWVASQDGTLNLLKQGQFSDFTRFAPRGQLTSLVQKADGTLWIGTEGGGVARWKGGHLVSFGKREGLPDETI